MSGEILKCGMLSVRSSKALSRIENAESNSLKIDNASYSFTGFESSKIILNNSEIILSKTNDSLKTDNNCTAVFFDQTHYMFSISLPDDSVKAYVFSPVASLCESSDWDADTKKLSIPVNFGNDLGDFEICWEWITSDGIRQSASFSSQVYSTKLDIYSHFGVMIDDVKERFKWIQLDILRQTSWGWSHDSNSYSSQKTWLLIFKEVRKTMEERFLKLSEHHRKRLVSEKRMLRADRIRKMDRRLEEETAEWIRVNPSKRYAVETYILDSDTPENRYIKHILIQTIAELNQVIDKVEPIERISDIFKNRLKEWSETFSRIKENRFWRGIGSYNGMQRASLILSQDPLYAGIRRSWFLLQQGLIFLDKDINGGIQNASQLYEIWCLVKLDSLISNCGWKCINDDDIDLISTDDDFSLTEDSDIGTFKFTYKNDEYENIELSLLFQPTAGKKPDKRDIWDGMMAVPVPQKPDIVLRLHRNDLPHKPVYTWIFDAKYRINNNQAPDDAVNQMHRYRDAIIWSNDSKGTVLKRESIGAYVLYPGDESITESSPQIASVKQTNIGAYPLKPDLFDRKKIPELLNSRITEFLTIDKNYDSVKEGGFSYLKSVPELKHSKNEIFAKCITKGNTIEKMNTAEYWKNCRLYRLPVSIAYKNKLSPLTWNYLIPSVDRKSQFASFPILSVQKMKRAFIKEVYKKSGIAIPDDPHNDERDYWLFELGDPLDNMPEMAEIDYGKIVFSDELSQHKN